MTQMILIEGISIDKERFMKISDTDSEIFYKKTNDEESIYTNIFLNEESKITLKESNQIGTFIQLHSKCDILSKLIVPAFVICVL
jgi:hypothetical protein